MPQLRPGNSGSLLIVLALAAFGVYHLAVALVGTAVDPMTGHYCPHCDSPLAHATSETSMFCPKCWRLVDLTTAPTYCRDNVPGE